MPGITRRPRQGRIKFDSSVLRLIGVGGLVACLSLTIRFHHILNLDTPPSVRRFPLPLPLHRHDHNSAATGAENDVAAASASANGASSRWTNNVELQQQQQQHAVAVAVVANNRNHTDAAANIKLVKPLAANTANNANIAKDAYSSEGISACLLVNDENPRLPEWIAYHYLTLPLRSLIVAVDPASRSSPDEILLRWYQETDLDVRRWGDRKYLPAALRGPCSTPDDAEKCLWHHRERQQHFVMKCMADHKRRNGTWVLLTDVDEYLTFNRARGDDPEPPMDEAPPGVMTMSHWKTHEKNAFVNGSLVLDGTVDGKPVMTILLNPKGEVDYGHVVEDIQRQRYFLRDDVARLESDALAEPPIGVPTAKEPLFIKNGLYVRIYNDTYDGNADGTYVQIDLNWENGDMRRREFYGGHVIVDAKGREYYIENEHRFWPPHSSATDALAARRMLPSVAEGRTALDVLNGGAGEGHALGPCLSVPRLLYGSREGELSDRTGSTTPDGFDEKDFVTLRYRWHASKGGFEANKYGKTVIDVSRVPMDALRGKALNIHRPLTYYCRKDPERYVTSLFRVNHYLDSYEAYSYRNDVRSSARQCKECYEKKADGAAAAMDNDMQPWLQRFVELMGHDKARMLLSNAGQFVKLG